MLTFTFIVKNQDGSLHTSYEEELTEKQVSILRAIIYKMVKDNDK